jgi:hypothetical protein
MREATNPAEEGWLRPLRGYGGLLYGAADAQPHLIQQLHSEGCSGLRGINEGMT